MRTTFLNLLRTAAVALALGFLTAPAADAGWWARFHHSPEPTPAVAADAPHGDPLIGAVAIVGGIAVLVFFAWVATRIGDTGH